MEFRILVKEGGFYLIMERIVLRKGYFKEDFSAAFWRI
jgi:hypothetical protein